AAAEVDAQSFVCNGAAGATGATGSTGATGATGLSSLVNLVPEPAGAHCTGGGVKIEAGIDDDADKVLEVAEVDSTQYVCDAASQAIPAVTPLPIVLAGNAATVTGAIESGDVLLVDGRRADAYSVTATSRALLTATASGVEIFAFTNGCLSIPDPSDWGACYVGPSTAAPWLDPGTYVLLIVGVPGNLWSSTPYSMSVALSVAGAGAAGIPDPGFGVAGIACVQVPALDATAAHGAVRPDGGIVLTGAASKGAPGADDASVLALLLAGGAPDPALPGGLRLETVPPWAANDVSLQPDGRIVEVGTLAGTHTAGVRRSLPNGLPDTTFGTSGTGTVSLDAPGFPMADGFGVAPLADGRILVSGSANDGIRMRPFVARLLPSGAIDTSFGSGGFAFLGIPEPLGMALAIAPRPDGSIVLGVSGFDASGTIVTAYAARLLPSGQPDASFGAAGPGLAAAGLGSVAEARVDAAGRVLLAGVDAGPSGAGPFRSLVVRLSPNGALDGTFGLGGRAQVDLTAWFPPTNTAAGISSQMGWVAFTLGERIGVAGTVTQAGVTRGTIVQLTEAGAVDAAFGTGGQVTVADMSPSDLVVGPSGELVIPMDRRVPGATTPTPQLCALRLR
ncbi:MAG TPA: hypothetical protein VLT47_09670, partial [Anaeromyxobacteraceae bacterium]|nr:hypothetical protein [Anaeromyxobacteraceae bacterium]